MSTTYMANNMPLQEEIKEGHIYAISFKNSDAKSKDNLSVITGALQSKNILSILKDLSEAKLTVSLVVRDNFADSFGKQVSYKEFRELLNIKDNSEEDQIGRNSPDNSNIDVNKLPDSTTDVSNTIGELRIHELTDYTSLES